MDLNIKETVYDTIFDEVLIYLKNKNITLTDKEQEVLYWLLLGLSNIEIGKSLIVTQYTVRKHVNNIYDKFYLEEYTNANKRLRILHRFLIFLLQKYYHIKILSE